MARQDWVLNGCATWYCPHTHAYSTDLDALQENVHCERCGKDTHQNRYTQYFYNASATFLRHLAVLSKGTLSLGRLLKELEQQAKKSCDVDQGKPHLVVALLLVETSQISVTASLCQLALHRVSSVWF